MMEKPYEGMPIPIHLISFILHTVHIYDTQIKICVVFFLLLLNSCSFIVSVERNLYQHRSPDG